jgi:hypothetical protein
MDRVFPCASLRIIGGPHTGASAGSAPQQFTACVQLATVILR